jgi:transcription elongation factor Elf1
MKRKIIEIIVKNFECYVCGHTEYTVLDPYSRKRKICCDKCGTENHVEYEVKNEPWWNKIMNMIRRK